jgi:YD repeat-containing protein
LKYILISTLFLLLSYEGEAQLLLNQEGEAFTDQPFFNADMIRSNHIKTIEGNYSTKKPGEVIHESTDWVRYRFDENGQLIESLDIRTVNKKKDTVLHQFFYDRQGALSAQRKSENGGYTKLVYDYDSLHRIRELNTYREVYNYRTNEVSQSILINTEYYQYSMLGNIQTRTKLNNYHLPYLDEISRYNQDGYLIERKFLYHMSGIEHHMEYGYDAHGLLSLKAHFNEKDDVADEEWKYRYDAYGNVMEAHFYRYGQFQKDLQVIFDTKTQLLGSTIMRDVSTNFLLILRFTKYTYFQ